MKTIEVGAQLADFTLPDQHGAQRSLSELLAGGPVVLFFYPAAMSSGCTKESCHFRNLAAEFKAVGAQPVGISRDPVDKQLAFDRKNHLGYPLLSDVDGVVSDAFGVRRALFHGVKRATFVLGADRRVQFVQASELAMDSHADQALAFLTAGAAGSASSG